MEANVKSYRGLSGFEARKRLAVFGANELAKKRKKSVLPKLLGTFSEPAFLLLIGAACLYFVLGEPRDGFVMLAFVVFSGAINLYQEWKTDKTLESLKSLSSPKVTAIRDGEVISLPSEEIVPGDIMIISEGERVAADCEVMDADGLGADESTLTGEGDVVWKTTAPNGTVNRGWRTDRCYAGTSVVAGRGVVRATATGTNTEFGKIGREVTQAPDRPTPLEKQTGRLVRDCSAFSLALLIFVVAATYLRGSDITDAALAGITIAMATIPEEFPVILTVFLALGAWRLAKRNALIRRVPAVETLGAVTVLCVDKTGTLTENRMSLKEATPMGETSEDDLLRAAVLASETNPFDPMERAVLDEAAKRNIDVKRLQGQRLLHDFPFSSESRMMCHVWAYRKKIMASAKGSPESVFKLCSLTQKQLELAEREQTRLADAGYRVLALAYNDDMGEIPEKIEDCKLRLAGFVAFADPPRENVPDAIRACSAAGVRVVMITGDSGATAHRIAHNVGLGCGENEHVIITGDELERLSDEELSVKLRDVTIFSRVLPREKMRIVKALKSRGEVVAMTGDGVNDAPALKYADIGVAMGRRGAEVAREAADMVLLDDDFSTIVSTIRDGRKIFDNIRKAMEYVLVIHIPIALSALAAPALGLPAVLAPLHVVLLEFIIDPTCSIIFERQPEERDIMERPPRDVNAPVITRGIFGKALAQGLAIFAAAFGSYALLLPRGGVENARTFFLTALVLANLFLVYVNRSESDFAFASGAKFDKAALFVNLGVLCCLVALSTTPGAAAAAKLQPLSLAEFCSAFAVAFASTFWWEIVKAAKKPTSAPKPFDGEAARARA